jgi:hypothetical protein
MFSFLPRRKSPTGTSRGRRIRQIADARKAWRHKRSLRLEALESRMLLSASVATDQTDYGPGETAILTASGFAAGETVQFQVLHVDDTPNTGAGHEPWQVADGSPDDMDGQIDGNVVTTWLVNEDDSYGSTFEVTATGLVSGESATATFYDGHIYYSRYHASGRRWDLEDS